MNFKKIKNILSNQWQLEKVNFSHEGLVSRNVKTAKKCTRFVLKKGFKKVYKKLKKWTITSTAIEKSSHLHQLIYEASQIEPKIGIEYLISPNIIVNTVSREPTPVANAFQKVMLAIDFKPDYLIITSEMEKGGAEWVTASHVNHLVESGKKVLLITTQGESTATKEWFVDQPKTIHLSPYLSPLGEDNYLELLLRICIQLKPKYIYNADSYFAWRLLETHGKQLASFSKIAVSLFGYLYHKDSSASPNLQMVKMGYIENYLKQTIQYIDFVFTDNNNVIKTLARDFGFNSSTLDKFHCIYYPPRKLEKVEAKYLKEATSPTEVKILWASRINLSKRPDLLLAIAKANPHLTFHMYGYVQNDPPGYKELCKTPNVKIMGGFTNYAEIHNENYTAFLYTSSFDGLPNILIETVLTGLPIVASIVGGIAEIVTEKTGFPIVDIEDISAYSQALNSIVNDPSLGKQKGKNAYDLIKTRHSKETFSKKMKEVGFV